MIALNQDDSNLYWFIKGWYKEDNFWTSITTIYGRAYFNEYDVMGMYHFVRGLWLKALEVIPNREAFLDAYDSMTLPSNNYSFRGGNKDSFDNPKPFNDEDLIRTRIAAMCSQLKCMEAKYFSPLPIVAIGDLMPKTV